MSSKNYLDKNGLTYFWGKIQNEISPKVNTSDVLTKTNTTSYTPTADYHPATKKYVDDKGFADLSDVFVITCSMDGNNNPVVDKTWNEIITAYGSGKILYATYENDCMFFPCVGYKLIQDGIINFEFAQGNAKITIWDMSYNQDGQVWEYEFVSDVVYIEVSYNNGTYSINNTASEILDMTFQYKTVVLVKGLDFYYLFNYNNLDILELYFLNYNGTLFKRFIVRDDLNGVTTVIFSSQQTQSDWNENTSTNPSYVANRTHYKTSGGYVFSFDEKLLSKISFYSASAEYDTNTDINKAYANIGGASFKTLVDNFDNYFPTNSLNDIDSSVENITVTIDNTDMVLSKLYVSDNSYFGTPTLYYYNNDFCLAFYEYGDLGVTIYANSLLFETINFNIPLTNEVFEYHYLNNNYLNGNLIHKGQGYKSEIYNGTNKYAGDFAHAEGQDEDISGISFTFIINGEANSKSYNFTTTYTQDDLYKLMNGVAIGLKLKVYDDNNYSSYHEATITNFYFNGNENEQTGIIYVDQTLNSENPIVDHYAYIESFYGTVAFGTGSHAEGSGTFASGNSSHAEGAQTTASGASSHAEGSQTRASRDYAHAEGNFTFANGQDAHAEGSNTKALGDSSHAEGLHTEASGIRSHAEGWGAKASGTSSHAEGYNTKASGDYAHAEGNGYFSSRAPLSLTGDANATTYTTYYNMHSIVLNHPKFLLGATLYSDPSIYITSVGYTDFTINSITLSKTLDSENAISSKTYYFDYDIAAKGANSHVEGTANTAAGEGSHAEGYCNMGYANYSHVEGRNTIASGEYQHVQGKYNIEDSSGTYAHIVGNGTANSRSNAHTLDWSGNGWYAGKLTVGIAPTNSMDVATKQYVDTAVSGVTDTNTTYTISISSNVITLTPSSGQAQSITLPVYDGSVSSS